ncbi:MAG: HU family DNA-binding protein [Deltaproteobacteria bacterium]|nr:HU family DNA-binding protein [Deltaproteobacteria bacterium]
MASGTKAMTKSQVTKYFAEKFELPKKTAAAIIDEVAHLAVMQTKKAGVFVLPGIGKLVKARRKARTGRNPATGEPIKIPAKTVVRMRLSKSYKDAVLG